jgi:hypothetical protein
MFQVAGHLVVAVMFVSTAVGTSADQESTHRSTFPSYPGGEGIPDLEAQAPVHVRVLDPSPGLGEMLEREGLDVILNFGDRLELLVHEPDLTRLVELGVDFEIGRRDLFAGAQRGLRDGNLDPEYHTHAEMLAELRALQADYPRICKLYDIGNAQSKTYRWQNYTHRYDIWALRISDNPAVDEPEPCVVYDGRHHAREPVSTELLLAVAQYFCQNYGHEASVTETVDRTEIWIVPMVNPDGHQWVEDNYPWWRKNLFDCNGNHQVNDNEGIDPNRNYDWHWASGNWQSQTYGGPIPWSAPEARAMRDLHQTHRTCLNATVHSFGEVIFYPFGYGINAEPALIEVANELGTRLGYDVVRSTSPYGTSKDWVYGSMGACSFTVETAREFIPSGPEMVEIVEELLPYFAWLATRAHGPSIQGTVRDALTGRPLLATIRIPEIQDAYGDGELWDMQTEKATGYFCRLRPQAPETITLEVSAPGHLPAIIEVTTGGRSEATVVDVRLLRRNTEVIALGRTIEKPLILGPNVPNPFRPHTLLSYALPQAGHATITVYDPAGRVVTTLVDQWLAGGRHAVRWDGRDAAGRQVAPGVYLAKLRGGSHEASWRMVRMR